MRIYGNRLLKTLPGQLTRPTSAKVREALFNIWQGSIEGCLWLDLCAGNGSMGAEALCRGAKEVIGIEKWGKACQIIRQNWRQVASDGQQFTVIQSDVLTGLKSLSEKVCDRIYFDPPYTSQLYQSVLAAIVTHQLLAIEGEIAVEYDPKFWNAGEIEGLEICRQKSYGNTNLTFYRREQES